MQDKKKEKRQRFQKEHVFPYTKENTVMFLFGFIVVVAGYICLSKGPWNSFWSLTLAPILLVVGYCVIFPIALLYQKKKQKPAQAQATPVQTVPPPAQQQPTP